MNARRASMAGILLVGVVLGAVREFLFLNLNYQVAHVRSGSPVSYAHSLFQGWVAGWDLAALMRLKWILAIVMAAAMLALAIALARVLWGDHRYRITLIAGFALAGIVALAAHFLSAWMPGLAMVSIKLLHALQYPVVLFLLWAASWLRRPEQG